MGRASTRNKNLPAGMRARHRKSGTYYYLDTGAKPRKEIPLGTDYVTAVQKWAELTVAKLPKDGQITFRYVAKRYVHEVIPSKASRTRQDNCRHILSGWQLGLFKIRDEYQRLMHLLASRSRAFDKPVVDSLQYREINQFVRVDDGVKRPLQEITFGEDDTWHGAAMGINPDVVSRASARMEMRRLSINRHFKILLHDASSSSRFAGKMYQTGTSLLSCQFYAYFIGRGTQALALENFWGGLRQLE